MVTYRTVVNKYQKVWKSMWKNMETCGQVVLEKHGNVWTSSKKVLECFDKYRNKYSQVWKSSTNVVTRAETCGKVVKT